MAHLRAHENSKFWYVRFKDPETARWREESTRLLRDDVEQSRQAQRVADKKTAAEAKIGGLAKGLFRDWVAEYIASHYRRDSTRRRAKFAWERLAEWLNAQGLRHPREIRHEHAQQYLDWRTGVNRARGDTAPSVLLNTALYEIGFLAFIINEAIRREYAERNVLLKLGIGRDPAKVKPEMTDAQIRAARAAFAERGWMRIACEIQIFTGCRISETSIPMTDVLFARRELRLTDAKRKPTNRRKTYLVPLNPALARTLRKIKTERTVPIVTTAMEARYNEVLKAATGTTSHSFRVTFISRCWEAGVSERDAMAFVNHSSKDVHAIYARTDTRRLRPAHALVKLPAPPSKAGRGARARPAARRRAPRA